MLVFFDDILIYNLDMDSHLQYLELVFQILQQQHIYAKFSKRSFAKVKIDYLGHLISARGVSTDPRKVAAMASWLAPSSIKELRSFLGLTDYYRKFIKNYGVISKPLTDL